MTTKARTKIRIRCKDDLPQFSGVQPISDRQLRDLGIDQGKFVVDQQWCQVGDTYVTYMCGRFYRLLLVRKENAHGKIVSRTR